MALTIEQIAAASFPAILADRRRPANQWMQNAALDMLEKRGFITRMNFGENIEVPLDYRPNSDGGVMASDQEQSALLKTEVITSAVYDIGQVVYYATWTRFDDVRTPSENEKIQFVASLIDNALNSHDDLIEQLIFNSSVAGGIEVSGLDVIVPTSGQGTVGGIDAGAETFWRNFADTYTDGSDIEAAMTEAYNEAAKASGATMIPKVILSGAEANTLYETSLQAQQRWNNTSSADGGYTSLKFKNADTIFSQYGDDKMYFLNPKNFKLVVSKGNFRDQGKTTPIQGQQAWYMSVYSALQFLTDNKSRLAVLSQA